MFEVSRLAAWIAPVILVTSCGNPDSQGSTSGQTSENAPAPVKRQPGSWSITHTTMAFDAENVEGGMAEMVKAGKASIGKKDVGGPLCLTAEKADTDDLTARLSEAIRFDQEYRVLRSEWKDGNVDFRAVREDPTDGKSELTITGTLTPTSTDLVVTTDAWQPEPGKGHIRTLMKQENSRVGDCSPRQDPLR